MDEQQPEESGIRVYIQMGDQFAPGPRTAAAVAELAAALEAEHGSGDDVVGFASGSIRNVSFGFGTTIGGSPNVLFDPDPPSDSFASTAGGSPNVLMDPSRPGGGFESTAGGSPNV